MDQSAIKGVKQRYGIVGNCEALERAIEVALKIAPVDLSVLVVGENGVGKETFPRIIHDHSLRKNRKYFAVNCGAIPEGTINSELFGHEKGAFTGAVEQREGYFAAANGGTLFLDEVGELPMQTQARLLRVLETGEYIRVGSSEVRKTDVRIVAATNVNMEKAIAEGRFREDLYYRLNTVSISVPALRERGTDAELLFRKFALDMSEKYKMPPIQLDAEARQMLLAYSWPGNVRQLKNLAENMSVTAEDRVISAEILRRYLPSESRGTQLMAMGKRGDSHSFEAEREILYQLLFDLRRDVTELKQSVRELQGRRGIKAVSQQAKSGLLLESDRSSVKVTQVKNKDFAPYLDAEEVEDEAAFSDLPDEAPAAPSAGLSGGVNAVSDAASTAVSAKAESASAESLDEVERRLIKQALAVSNGRRKAAADRLGISERTLYRKIKEYGLE